jgi:hypothetical protein
MGFGTTTGIDIVITAMMCLVLHKERMDIGVDYISRRSDKMLRSLITYALATGFVTSFASLLVIVLVSLFAYSAIAVARALRLIYDRVVHSTPEFTVLHCCDVFGAQKYVHFFALIFRIFLTQVFIVYTNSFFAMYVPHNKERRNTSDQIPGLTTSVDTSTPTPWTMTLITTNHQVGSFSADRH